VKHLGSPGSLGRQGRRRVRGLVAWGAALWIAAAPLAARAETESMRNEAGLGAAAAACTLLYGPAKLLYAGLGGLGAGLAWLLSAGDNEVAGRVLNRSLRGDYVITPAHLRGERPVTFIGRDPGQQQIAQDPVVEEGF
jgi:hypothetical protein